MKKILAALVLLVYFTVSTGFAVSVHYCMDKFDSAQIGADHDDVCGKCGMENGDKKCCWDEVQVLKLQTSHMISQAADISFYAPLTISVVHEYLLTPFMNFVSVERPLAHGPPLNGQSLHIKNCVFRI